MKDTFIYALCCPDSGEVRYVGKANNPNNRIKGHIRDGSSEANNHKVQWLKGLLAAGKQPKLKILAKVPLKFWEIAEREYITLYRGLMGKKLTNIGDGGEGTSNAGELNYMFGRTHTPEARAKISAKSKQLVHTPETKARLAEASRNRIISNETRLKIGLIRKGAVISDETKAKMAEKRQGTKHSDETKAKISAAQTGEKNWLFGKHLSDECKAKLSVKLKGRTYTPETLQRMAEANRRTAAMRVVLNTQWGPL